MLTRQNLRGTWATVLLPIEADDSIQWDRLEDELKILAGSGVAGIYTNGSAGEFFSQTNEEFLRLSQMVAQACCRAQIPFQLGACHPCAGESLKRIELAKSLKPDAFQVILPDWFPVKRKEAATFLQRIAEVAEAIPLVLYLPPHAKSKFKPEDIAHLGRSIPTLIGVKVAGGDATWYQDMRHHEVDLAVFVAGHRLASGLSQGAHGSYSNVACIHPRAAVRWYELMKSDPARALEIEKEIQAFIHKRIVPLCDKYVDAAIDKLLAHAGGWSSVGTRLRWPYDSPSPAEAAEVCLHIDDDLSSFFYLVHQTESTPVVNT
jgi:4-hydroxy-tetrahydrodipicolinate synthase